MMSPIFPGGTAGAGLLFLRLSLAISLLGLTSDLTSAGDWRRTPAIIAAVALCAGFQSRPAAGLSLLAPLCALSAGLQPTLSAVHVATGLALCLVGPGAFSADAGLFGRRKIRLSRGRPPGE